MATTIKKDKSKLAGLKKFFSGTKQQGTKSTGGFFITKTGDHYKTIKEPKNQTQSVKGADGVFFVGISSEAVGTQKSSANQKARAMKLLAQIAKLERELKTLNIVEVPKVILSELHDAATGRIDAQKVADFMSVPLKQLSEGLGLYYKAVHRNPSAAGFQQALRPVKRSLELLHEFFGPVEAVRAWLNTPHPDLDGASALETILEGKADAVALILENAWNGIPV